MRASTGAAVAVGSFLLLSPLAMAQQPNPGGGLGGALDSLNRAVNPGAVPDNQRDERRVRDGENSRRDPTATRDRDQERGVSGSSMREDRAGRSYRQYSDQELRTEAARVREEEQQIRHDRQALDEELERRRAGR